MDLSEVQNLHESLRFIKNRNESVSPTTTMYTSSCDFDTIDVNRINFENNESWLYKPPNNDESPIRDLNNWLYNDSCEVNNDDYFPIPKSVPKMSQNEFQKNIDTRTFTRPKKRFTRPSIEKFNEEIYGSIRDTRNENTPLDSFKKPVDSDVLSNTAMVQEVSEPTIVASNPLNFDLSQPTNSYYFENILANSGDVDSFQNMSPPSLVNSMCSSTFANLMESSFIKNDPVLREIRDTDYTETVLLQDSEPPMFQSITESCSSINSDTPENFLKKISFSGTFRKTVSSETDESAAMEKSSNSTINLNMTYEKSKENDLELQDLENVITEDVQEIKSQPNFIGTYRRTPKSNNTFTKSDVKNATMVLSSTFKMSPKDEIPDQYTTQMLIKDSSLKSFENKKPFSNRSIIKNDSVEDMKKQLSETVQITDLNRLSYCLDENIRIDSMYTENNDELNRTVNMKRSSLGCSTGSADSLDRMSSLSNSSRESNKILNMADVDAIVEMQERSLQQVMSTPKPNGKSKKLWENNFISPIISNERLSDSDLSSNDEYKSVKSTLSKASLENYASKPTKSLGYLGNNIDTKLRINQRSTYTLAGQKPLHAISNNIRSSYSNLKTVHSNMPGSQSNLYRPSNVIKAPTSATNLLTMGQKLKGSYTSLRPISANLPVAPPITSQLNTTTTLSRATNPNIQSIDGHAKVVEVAPMPREKPAPTENHFVKPQQPRISGLPRPTGIPRPASRIPGPRSNLRPASSRGTVRRQTKDDYQ